jgi:hypothetical protein
LYADQAIASHRQALAKSKAPLSESENDEDGEEVVTLAPATPDIQAQMQAQIALLNAQLLVAKNTGGTPAITPSTQTSTPIVTNPPTGNNPLAPNDTITRIEKLAADFALAKQFVTAASEGKFTEIWQTSKLSMYRQSQTAVNNSGTAGTATSTFTTSSKKAVLPQNFGEWSSQIGTLETIRQAFSVPGFTNDRPYVDFFRDVVWLMFSPLGVAAFDRYIRMHAATTRIPWWPIPAETLTLGLILALPHLQQPDYCELCGQISHSSQLCPLSETLSSSAPATTAQPKTPGAPGSSKKKKKKKELCWHFMRTGSAGVCNPYTGNTCAKSHLCPNCKGVKTHKRNCNRK